MPKAYMTIVIYVCTLSGKCMHAFLNIRYLIFFFNRVYERKEDWKTFLKDRGGRKTGTLSARAFKRHIDYVLSIKNTSKN